MCFLFGTLTLSVNVSSAADGYEGKKRGRNGYVHTYAEHAEWYGVSLRTVKRWAGEGKNLKRDGKGDLCPLDNPDRLYSWLSQHVQATVPEGVAAAVIQWRKSHGVNTGDGILPTHPVGESEEVAEERAREVALEQPVAPEELGLEAALRRLQITEVQLHRFATDRGGTKPWLDTLSRMTAVSAKLREELESLGELIPRQMAEGILVEMMQPVEQGVRGLYADMCHETGLVACPKAEVAWRKVCDSLFVVLGKEVFGGVS